MNTECYERFVELVKERLEPDANIDHVIEATLLTMGERLLDVPEHVTTDPLPAPLARTLHRREYDGDFDLRALYEAAVRRRVAKSS